MDNTPYAPPAGQLYLVTEGNQALGCAALRPLDHGIVELKRLYIRPAARGRGVGTRLMEQAMTDASTYGYQAIRLDSLRRLEGARRLYVRFGFHEIAPYTPNPEPDVYYMECSLQKHCLPQASHSCHTQPVKLPAGKGLSTALR